MKFSMIATLVAFMAVALPAQVRVGELKASNPQDSGPEVAAEATHEHLISPLELRSVDSEGRIETRGMKFADSWLRRELLEISGVAKVSFVDRIVSTRTFRGTGRKKAGSHSKVESERWVRVDGSKAGVAAASALIRRVKKLDQRQILIRTWIVRDGIKNIESGLRYLDNVDLEAEVAAFREANDKKQEKDVPLLKDLPLLADLFGKKASWMSSPSLLVNLGQQGEVFVGKETAYIKDFEVEVGENSMIADPVVDKIWSGLRMKCAAVVDPRTGKLNVQFETTIQTLEMPMKEFTTKLAGFDQPVTIQLPESRMSKFGSDEIELPGAGGSFSWDATFPEKGGGRVNGRVLVQMKVLDLQAGPFGSVMGVDRKANRAFVDLNREVAEGASAEFRRGDARVGTGIVESVGDGFAVLRVKEGSPRAGDVVREAPRPGR